MEGGERKEGKRKAYIHRYKKLKEKEEREREREREEEQRETYILDEGR